MSKSYSMAGWADRILLRANSEMVRALATIKGLLRTTGHLPARFRLPPLSPMRHCERPRSRGWPPSIRFAATSCAMVWAALGWEIDVPRAGMFVWARIPEPLGQNGFDRFSR